MMATIHKNLLICVLYQDIANSSVCLIPNVWLTFCMGVKLGPDVEGGT
jgi:hypothetical protein